MKYISECSKSSNKMKKTYTYHTIPFHIDYDLNSQSRIWYEYGPPASWELSRPFWMNYRNLFAWTTEIVLHKPRKSFHMNHNIVLPRKSFSTNQETRFEPRKSLCTNQGNRFEPWKSFCMNHFFKNLNKFVKTSLYSRHFIKINVNKSS